MNSEQMMNPRLYQDKKGHFEQDDFFQYWNLKKETEYHVSYTNQLEPETGYLAEFNEVYPGLQSGLSSIIHSESPGIALIGGAGTGKTRLIASLAGYWVREKLYEPGEILGIAFTRAGISILSEGILQAVKEKASGIEVTGIDGLCLTLLSRVYGSTPRIFDKKDRSHFIALIFPFLSTGQKERLSAYISSPGESKLAEEDQDFPHLRETYFHSLHNIGACDRDVLTLQTTQLITGNPGILISIQQKYRCIFIDDLHYMEKDQYSLLSQIIAQSLFLETGGDQKIVATLDPFQGKRTIKSQHISQDFISRFMHQHYVLQTSWRVPGKILKSIRRLYKNRKTEKQKLLTAPGGTRGHMLLYKAPNPGKEGDFIINTILSYKKQGSGHQEDAYAWKDFGIFCRDSKILAGIMAALKEQHLPFFLYQTKDPAEQLPFHIVYSVFHFLLAERDITAFVDILLYLIPGFSIGDIQSIFLAGNRKDESLSALIRRLYNEQMLTEDQYNGIISFQKTCVRIKKEVAEAGILSGVKLLIAEYPGLARKFRDYFTVYPREKDGFVEHTREFHKDIPGFLAKRFYSPLHGIKEEKKDYIHVSLFDHVPAVTPPVVFIPGMEEGFCPLYTDSPDMEREKSLFYSALTRAKEQVYLTYTEQRTSRGSRMSSFIKEMGPHIKHIIHSVPVDDFTQGTLF
jgi:DNA helicase II / ATP-dependent DNA helicase PcrA